MAKKDGKSKKAVKPAKRQSGTVAKPSTSSASTSKPPAQLMDLVESFLSDQGFDNAHREFKKHRATKAWKGHTTDKSSTKEHHSLVSIFQSWETFASKDSTPNATAQVTNVSSNSGQSSDSSSDSSDSDESSSDESSDDDDVAMADAPAAESSSSESSSSESESDSESESGSDEEEAATSKAPTSKAAPIAKSLKRKAESDSESSSSDSDSDEDMSSSNAKSDKEKPQSKKAKIQDSSDDSSSSESSSESDSSDDDSSDDEPKPKAKAAKTVQSDSDSSSESDSDDSSSSESESDSEDEVEVAAKVPLPPSDSESSSESESESEENSKNKADAKAANGAASDSSVTLEKASPEFAPLPPNPSTLKVNNRGNGATPKRSQNQPFSRIAKDVVVDPRLSSNAYVSHGYGEQAHRDLIVTKGKGFTKEKNKKKRGSYKGGPLDVHTSRSFKFDD